MTDPTSIGGQPLSAPGAATAATRDTVEFVDLRELHDDGLLEEFYQQLYSRAFPIEEEREDPNIWRPLLWKASTPYELHLVLAAMHLHDPSRRRLLGAHLFEYYPRSRCGLLTYLVVAPQEQHHGLGTRLLAEGLSRLQSVAQDADHRLRAVFAEVNDPEKVPAAEDVIPPQNRLAFFLGRRGHVVDIPYVQPPLRPGRDRCRQLLLLVFPPSQSDSAIPASVLFDFLHEFYQALGITDPESDADFKAMTAAYASRAGFIRYR